MTRLGSSTGVSKPAERRLQWRSGPSQRKPVLQYFTRYASLPTGHFTIDSLKFFYGTSSRLVYRLSKFAAAPPLSPEPMQLLQSSRRSTSLLALIIFLHFISHGFHAFFLPIHVSLTHLSTKTVRSVSVPVKAAGSGSESSSPKSSPLGPVQNIKRATSTAALLLGTCIGSFDTSGVPPSQAADLTPLPPEFRTAIMAMRDAAEPLSLRDAAKAVSELPGLDELLYDDGSRRAINTELKELRQERPDLWDAETSYYGGVIRRAVNPFHVLELIPLLKVGPFVGGVGYFLAIVVQRKFPRFFALAYFGAIASLVAPAVYLILYT